MSVLLVANPKGGVGKSTLATQAAGYFAAQGHSVMLGDADRQQSAALWLGLRPAAARPIRGWEVASGTRVRPPKGTRHVVIDTPAGLHGSRLKDLLALADRMLVPLQPSVFDIFATRAFLDDIRAQLGPRRLRLGLVGMRVDSRTIAADKLRQFVEALGVPVVGNLRDTQNYVHLAARGLTLFDIAPGRVERDLEQWAPICEWLSS